MAQLVARLVRNEKVGGSNPPSSTHEPPDQKPDQGVSHDRGQKKSWKRNCSTQYGQPSGPSSSSPSFTHWLTNKVKSSWVAPRTMPLSYMLDTSVALSAHPLSSSVTGSSVDRSSHWLSWWYAFSVPPIPELYIHLSQSLRSAISPLPYFRPLPRRGETRMGEIG